jgi:hypothetical protein
MKLHWLAFILVSVSIAVIAVMVVGSPLGMLIYGVILAGVMYINAACIAGVLTLIWKWRRPNSVPHFGKLFAWSTVALVSALGALGLVSWFAERAVS